VSLKTTCNGLSDTVPLVFLTDPDIISIDFVKKSPKITEIEMITSVLLKIPVSTRRILKQIRNLFWLINPTHLVALWSASPHVKFDLKTTGTEIINPACSITVLF
jgi:hypothetical protein